jgi:signal transduction histidine kinase
MITSFRLRLALLSAMLSGLVLAAFGLGSLWLIRGLKTEKIDLEIRTQAEREVARGSDATGWQAFEGDLVAAMGIRDSADLAIWVQSETGDTLFQSSHWPAVLNVGKFSWPVPGSRPRKPLMGATIFPSAYAGELPYGPTVLLAQAGGGRPGGGGRPAGPPPNPTSALNSGLPPGMPGNAQIAPPPPGTDPSTRPPPLQNSGTTSSRAVPEPAPIQPDVGTLPQPRVEAPIVLDVKPVSPPATTPPAAIAPAPNVEQQTLPAAPANPAAVNPQPLQAPPPASDVTVINADGHEWRLAMAATDRQRIAIAVDARFMDADMRGNRNAFLLVLPFALVLIGVGSWYFSGRALKPVNKLTEATRRVTAEGLSQRISAKGEDREFAGLIDVFNRMLERLERSFQQAHRFSADAAHELKTPLAIVQGQLERAIGQAGDGSPMQASLTSILDEVRRLSTISRKLLLLSQADAGRLSVFSEPFDLSTALEDLLEDTRMLAPHLRVTGEIQPGLMISGDASLLRQVLHNLISNAIKYNQAVVGKEGEEALGWIHISTTRWAKRVEIVVANSSTGIDAGLRDKIFERFFRADTAHSRNIEGVGLGLSVSREIARAHGGDLTLRAEVAGQVQFSLLLPLPATSVVATSPKK